MDRIKNKRIAHSAIAEKMISCCFEVMTELDADRTYRQNDQSLDGCL